jgi:hypothetical protein
VANAILYDIVANVAAIPASPANNDAVEVTDSTGIQSFTPLTGVPAGFVGSSGLSVRLVYTTTGSTWNWIQYFPNDPETRYLKLAGGTLTGDLTVANQGDIRFGEATANGSNYVAIQAPSSLAANVTYTLPSADGTSGQLLSTDGTGTLSWATASGGSSVTTSDTPPATPNDGDLWYDSVGGRTYVYYQDPNGSQWVDASPQGGGSSTSITTGNTTAEVIDTGSDGRFVVTTEGSERLRVDSSGRLGIGTASPSAALHVERSSDLVLHLNRNTTDGEIARFAVGGTSAFQFSTTSTTRDIHVPGGTASLTFTLNSTERARIDSSGRLLVGTTSARGIAGITSQSQIEGTTFNSSSFSLTLNSNDAQSPYLEFAKTRGTSNGSNTVVQSGDQLGYIGFAGADGSDLGQNAAAIAAYVDGTPGNNDMPGRLVFSTTADGASSPTERMRIDSYGIAYHVSTNHGFLLGTTQASGLGYYLLQGKYGATAGSPGSGTASLEIYSNGNIRNTNNSYTAISDIKLKENVVDAALQWGDIKALRVVNYSFKPETGHETFKQLGLIAQEVEQVCPGLVSETPDRDDDGNDLGTVTKSVNYSVLYMKAVKALQEAMERIEALEAQNASQAATIASFEARLTALEGGTN